MHIRLYVACVDMDKASDLVYRNVLRYRLYKHRVSGNMLSILTSVYDYVTCTFNTVVIRLRPREISMVKIS